jgi:hypothetical protein
VRKVGIGKWGIAVRFVSTGLEERGVVPVLVVAYLDRTGGEGKAEIAGMRIQPYLC